MAVTIEHLTPAAFAALARGDVAGLALTPYLTGPQCRGLWRMRCAQVAVDPAAAGWVTGIVRDPAGAAREPTVRRVRASISPDNLASATLVAGFGFAEVGEQWDEEDGMEIVYEAAA